MRPPKYRMELPSGERRELEKIIARRGESQNIARRAKIILLANGERRRYQDIAAELGVRNSVVTTWTKRWADLKDRPVMERLRDLARPGAPGTFTPEQQSRIMALACEKPERHGLPITRWTHRELADEAAKQGIVVRISPTHVGRFLKKKRFSPIEAATG